MLEDELLVLGQELVEVELQPLEQEQVVAELLLLVQLLEEVRQILFVACCLCFFSDEIQLTVMLQKADLTSLASKMATQYYLEYSVTQQTEAIVCLCDKTLYF